LKLLPAKRSPLAWALPDEVAHGDTRHLLERIERLGSPGGSDQAPEKLALQWLAGAAGAAPGPGYALEALAWGHALPRCAGSLSPDAWWGLLDHLLGAVAEAGQTRLDDEPLVHQMLAGELPLALSYLFPEITPCRKLAKEARRALSAGLVDLLDGQGLPHAKYLGLLRPLLACWTRCRAMGNELSGRSWSQAAQSQYEWLVRHALRLTRHDGSHVLSHGSAGAWCEELFEAALRFGGDPTDHKIAARVLPRPGRPGAGQIGQPSLPGPATHSEWAAVGVLRTGWSRADPRMTVAYPDRSVRIELGLGREILCSGVWDLEVSCDGRPVPPVSEWEQLCWLSDEDVDYLELEIQLRGGLRVQRHMALAREDHFLFLADAILGDRPAELEYRGCLPLGEQMSFQPAEETREGLLAGRRRLARVFPLALPEWRADPRVGTLVWAERGLELAQRTRGRSLFAPLFFDLRPRRLNRAFTWRRLTVAENLRIQPGDVAVGYRVTVGKEHWLIYRSLAKAGNRTLLGHNLTSELLVARFDRDGEVEPLVEVEDG
jgi:hypothetical protein